MNNNALEKLKKRLYRKGENFKEREERIPLTPIRSKVKTYWQKEEPSYSEQKYFFKNFFFIAVGIFILVVFGFSAYYFFFGGPSVVSSRNIEIKFEGPTTIKGGEEGLWQVLITNKNKTDIELADLIIEYPEDSRPVSDSFKNNKKAQTERRPIGSIKAGQIIEQQIRAYLFGEKDSDKKFKLSIEYRPQGSNAILEKTQEATIRLLQSPIEVSAEMPEEANAGELFSFKIDVISNAEAIVKDLHLKIEYPAGFRFEEADLKPASGDNIWRLGDLEPNKKRTLMIKGTLEGQDQMELTFRSIAGPVDENGEVSIYGFNISSVTLKKPFLNLRAIIHGKKGEAVFSPGEDLQIEIEWQNTLPVKIYNASIEAKIEGEAVDRKTISVKNGFYRSFDETLVWNQSGIPQLKEIEPLASDSAQFSIGIFSPLPQFVIIAGNPTVKIDIEMKAERISDSGTIEIKNHLTKEIKIATLFQMNRRAFYYSGPFQNTGPMPPKAGKETTYTIVWSLSNTSNDVSDAVVRAFLPSYTRWLGAIMPEDADVSYNQGTGEIVWRPGIVPKITSKELIFQIAFLPNVAQIGAQPVLVSETTLSGKDSFTGAFLRDMKSAQNTYLDSDAQFKYNEAIVAQ